MLNYQPSFFFKEKDKLNTFPGTIITIIACSAIIVLGIFFLKQCTDREKYNLSSTDLYNGSKNFTFDDFKFAFSVRNGFNEEIPELFRLINFEYAQPAYNKLKGRDKYDFIQPSEMTQCNAADIDPTNKTNMTNPVNKGYWCPPKDAVHNYLRYSELMGFIQLIFYPCQNTTLPDGTIKQPACYSPEVIREKLTEKEMFLFAQMRNTDVDHSAKNGKDNIFKPYVTQFIFKFSLDIFLRYQIQLQPVKYEIDLGYIFEDFSIYESYRYLKYEMQVDSVKPIEGTFNKHKNKFAMIDIILSEEQRIFSRDYVKLQTVAANIGGVAKFFLTVSQILMFYYSKQLFISEFANSVMNYSNETKVKFLQQSQSHINPNTIQGAFNNKINMDVINDLNKSKNALVDGSSNLDALYIQEEKSNNEISNNFKNLNTLKTVGLSNKKLAIENSNLLYYCKSTISNDLLFKLMELKEERLNQDSNDLYEVSLLDKLGLESKRFKLLKKSVAKILSIDNLLNNITQLVHLKNYIEKNNDLIYFGDGIDSYQCGNEVRNLLSDRNIHFIHPSKISKFNNMM